MNKGLSYIVLGKMGVAFNNWLVKNHEELLKHDVVYSLSLIENKWESLKFHYIDIKAKKLVRLLRIPDE